MSDFELPGGNSPFINSDVLINALVEKDEEAKGKLKREEEKLNLEKGERFIISDLVINDVLTAAQVAQIPLIDILNIIDTPTGTFFRFIVGRSYIERVFTLQSFLRQNCLTITDWVTLWIMRDYRNKILISDKREIDDILSHKDFVEYFRGIRRV